MTGDAGRPHVLYIVKYTLWAIILMLLPLPLAVSDVHEERPACDRVIGGIVAYLKSENATLSERKMTAIARQVYYESGRYKIDYRLILALMKIESNFRDKAVSRKGAVGLLQIKPSTGKSVAEDIGMDWKGNRELHEPARNIRIGVYHLSTLMARFTNLSTALTAYNRGAKRTKTAKGRNNRRQARYARAVMQEYEKTLSVLPDP